MSILNAFLSCNQVNEDVVSRNALYTWDSALDALAPLEEKTGVHGVIAFKKIFEQTVFRYNQAFPMPFHMVFPNGIVGNYTFRSNFEQLLEGKITEPELILVPVSILSANGNGRAMIRSLRYIKPTLYAVWQIDRLNALVELPSIVRFNDNETLSEDSGIYGDVEYEKFLVFFEYNFLRYLKSQRDNVKLQLPIELFGNLDELISENKEVYDTLWNTNAQPFALWGLRGY